MKNIKKQNADQDCEPKETIVSSKLKEVTPEKFIFTIGFEKKSKSLTSQIKKYERFKYSKKYLDKLDFIRYENLKLYKKNKIEVNDLNETFRMIYCLLIFHLKDENKDKM